MAAFLLKEQGYDVAGLFMINWHDTTGTLSGDCSWHDDRVFAELVAKKLDIPLHTVDLSEQYGKRVVDYMFSEYAQGRTPNPDVLCNREIKFDVFLDEALKLDADYIATGHYCRREVVRMPDGEETYRLLAGSDPGKDQSYFLCQLTQKQLSRSLFPIGHLMKSEVRDIAAAQGLATARRKDSQGICFVGKVDLPVFLQQKLAAAEGDVVEIPGNWHGYAGADAVPSGEPAVDPDDGLLVKLSRPYVYAAGDGTPAGKHDGAHFFTIGQRKGLGIGGRPEPLFVIASDVSCNILYVGQGDGHPGLYRRGVRITPGQAHWIRPDLRLRTGESRRVEARIRYRQPLQKATLYARKTGAYLIFDNPQRGVTPGQFAAWYEGDELTGSGVISE